MLWLWGSMGKGGNKVWLMFLPEISTEPCHYPIWRGGPKGQNKRLYNLQVWLGNVILMSWKVPTNSYSKRKSKASEPPLEVTLRDPKKKKKWRVKWPRDPLSTSLSDHVINRASERSSWTDYSSLFQLEGNGSFISPFLNMNALRRLPKAPFVLFTWLTARKWLSVVFATQGKRN